MDRYITLVRSIANHSENAIIGHLYIDGVFFCTTLENFDKRIPSGTYSLTLTYSPRFKKKLPLIAPVPKRSGIRIHSGNFSRDSQGCVLVGLRDGYYTLKDSRVVLNRLLSILFTDGNEKYKFIVK